MSAPGCEIFANWDGKPPYCGKPAVTSLRGGCVHEHVQARPVPACAECAGRLRAQTAITPFVCLICEDGPEPHECPALVEWVPLEVPA